MRKTARLRELLAGDSIVLAGGAHDAFSARLVEQAGFELCVVTGAGVAACRGYPDVGLVTLEEMTRNARYIADAIKIPVIIDADNGYGNALNVRRTVEELETAGVCGMTIEDTDLPQRFGSEGSPSLISIDEGIGKMKAALDARQDLKLVIAGRTSAPATTGIDDAIIRAKAYEAIGVDAIFLQVSRPVHS